MLDSELERLLAGLCDGTLTDEETRQLGERIATSNSNRRAYLEYLDLHAALLGESPYAAVTESLGDLETKVALPSRWSAVVQRLLIGAASLAAAVLVMVVGWQWLQKPELAVVAPAKLPSQVPTWARITDVVGSVELRGDQGEPQLIQNGLDLAAGQTLRTGSDDSFAVIELADGGRLLLCPESQLRLTRDHRLVLSAGVLQADVPKLLDDNQLLVVTPQAEIAVRETRCVVSTPDSGSTAVETSSGLVNVLRTADGSKAEVPAGYYAVAVHDERDMTVRPVAQLPTQPHAHLALEQARALAFRGNAAIVAASAERLASFDRATGEAEHLSPLQRDASFHLLAAAKGNVLIQGDRQGRWQSFDPRSGDLLIDLETGIRNPTAAAINERGNLLAVTDQRSGRQFVVRRWDLQNSTELPAIEVAGKLFALAMTRDGSRLALALEKTKGFPNHRLEIWQTGSPASLTDPPRRLARVDMPDRPLRVLAFSPDGTKLAGANDRGIATIWEASTGAELQHRGAPEGWTHPLTSLAFAPDGDLLAAGSNNGRVRLWNTSSGDELGVLTCGTRIISALAFSPEGDELAVGAVRGKVLLYRLPGVQNAENAL